MQHISELLTQDQLNHIADNAALFTELSRLSNEDPQFVACQGYPGGTVIANKKGSVRLDGIRLRLGVKFVTTNKLAQQVINRENISPKKIKPVVRKVKKGKAKRK
ncbi:hypothetical protein AVA65_07875 [Salmonella enterica subsp. enterica serovar Minnesota]|nr:hypothetical protein [Salmonella enterica subsp. enterica serovar Minnesota]